MADLKFKPLRHNQAEFLAKAKQRPGFVEAYESLELEYALASQMLKARAKAGLTQDAVAERMESFRTFALRVLHGQQRGAEEVRHLACEFLRRRGRQALHVAFMDPSEGLVHRRAEQQARWHEVWHCVLDVPEGEGPWTLLVRRHLGPRQIVSTGYGESLDTR